MFAECNRRLLEAGDTAGRVSALNRNHRMWSALMKDVGLSSNPLPSVLKKDLAELGAFAMRYSTLAVLNDLTVNPLVSINVSMIDGLTQQGRVAVSAVKNVGFDRKVV